MRPKMKTASMHRERTPDQVVMSTGIVEVGGGCSRGPPNHDHVVHPRREASVAEINQLHAAGADIVRVAVPEKKDTEALAEILSRTSVPIVADVHFHSNAPLRPWKPACTRST